MIPNASRPKVIHFQILEAPSLSAGSVSCSTALARFTRLAFGSASDSVSAESVVDLVSDSASSSGSASSRVSVRSSMSVMIRAFLLLPFVVPMWVWVRVGWQPAAMAELILAAVYRAVAIRVPRDGCAVRPGC
ncbi:Uncharacterised protein [Mycobacteroides abscessus subsp. massiliense]|nr:Uncharacterised protein [Mycobacteroides abscessus subsp. massiliense]